MIRIPTGTAIVSAVVHGAKFLALPWTDPREFNDRWGLDNPEKDEDGGPLAVQENIAKLGWSTHRGSQWLSEATSLRPELWSKYACFVTGVACIELIVIIGVATWK